MEVTFNYLKITAHIRTQILLFIRYNDWFSVSVFVVISIMDSLNNFMDSLCKLETSPTAPVSSAACDLAIKLSLWRVYCSPGRHLSCPCKSFFWEICICPFPLATLPSVINHFQVLNSPIKNCLLSCFVAIIFNFDLFSISNADQSYVCDLIRERVCVRTCEKQKWYRKQKLLISWIN